MPSTLNARGVVRGDSVKFEEPLPFAEGQEVLADLHLPEEPPRPGTCGAVLAILQRLPPLPPGTIEEFQRALEEGRLPPAEPPDFSAFTGSGGDEQDAAPRFSAAPGK